MQEEKFSTLNLHLQPSLTRWSVEEWIFGQDWVATLSNAVIKDQAAETWKFFNHAKAVIYQHTLLKLSEISQNAFTTQFW